MTHALKQEGLTLFNQGQRQAALAKFQAAAQFYQQSDNLAGQAEMLNNIGVIYRLERQWNQAADALNRAQETFAALGDAGREGQVLGNLGDLYAARKELDQAARCYSEAAALFAQVIDAPPAKSDVELDDLPDPAWMQSQALRALCLARLRQRRIIEAIVYWEQSLAAHPRPGPLRQLARLLARLALLLSGLGRQ